ncbi:MAG: 1-deoxy-D-xylulose-5-phosphate synthase [Bacteroidales bacterium]|nr:1-deoxy-D-xylulose-5-phosphate synthase [Bacteroidales bacterium]
MKIGPILSEINDPRDLKNLGLSDLLKLPKEMRDYIIDMVSIHKGHLASSLGVVELSIALHYVFNTPYDKLIWDVGHQAYPHKILTGRKDNFHTNRKLGGISGFPKMDESEYDAFGVGHSSTSISAVLGMAEAALLKGEINRQHIAVIGDGAISAGMAFEALNNAGVSQSNILVILNDNGISIDPSAGAIHKYLTDISKDSTHKNNIFKLMNFEYCGRVDGHNLEELIQVLNQLKAISGPKFLHIRTIKGKGLATAEDDPITFHAPGLFDRKTGVIKPKNLNEKQAMKFQDVFGETLLELAEQDERVVGVTPAMPTGSSLNIMMKKYPERVFDVGIAEQHAVTFSAGLATAGMTPFCNIYSSFMQRAYDQLIHDVALQNLPVIFCLDRAGLVGEDGPTHHGAFDLAFLRAIPNMIIAAPMDEWELRNMMFTAKENTKSPFSIRYPRGRGFKLDWKNKMELIEIGKARQLQEGHKVAVLGIGAVGDYIQQAIAKAHQEKIYPAFYDMRFLKPIDEALVKNVFEKYDGIITVEDGSMIGGLASAIAELAVKYNHKGRIVNLGIPDGFIEHGSPEELKKRCGFDTDSICKHIIELS